MKYTVVWKRSAERELADIWLHAMDRPAVTVAANRIDRVLDTDPANAGESRSGPTRFLVVPPLSVTFEVHEPDRLVRVLSIGRLRSR